MSRSRSMLALGAVVTLVAACSSTGAEVNQPWSEPAWMAEQAQAREEFVARLQACMDTKGWNLTVDASAGFLEPFGSLEEMERARADADDCLNEQGIDPTVYEQPLTEDALRRMHRYDVDTYECLVAQGVEMERTPPTVDRYVEEGLSAQAGNTTADSWWPYGDPAVLALGEQEVARLRQVCPERWTFASLS